MKDIYEAIESRIKSPIFGYFILSMVAFNWQAFFFLLLDNGSVTSRLAYFDEHTKLSTLIIYPILLASFYSILYPWVQYFFILCSSKPSRLKTTQNLKAEHQKLVEQQKLAKERTELEKALEDEIIDRAKRDQKLTEEIEDDQTREKVKSEIKEIRQNNKERGHIDLANSTSLNTEENYILELITQKGGSLLKSDIISLSDFEKVKTEYYLESLEEKSYLRSMNTTNGRKVNLTTKSKKLMVENGIV